MRGRLAATLPAVPEESMARASWTNFACHWVKTPAEQPPSSRTTETWRLCGGGRHEAPLYADIGIEAKEEPILTQTTHNLHPINESASGISGMAVYVPSPRVSLESWCGWTGNTWAKVEKVVGRSFRVPAGHENVYTMAANAVLRLILSYDIDPTIVGFLGLGTESSTDNAAGAVIVRGMVDRALDELGLPRLSRQVEVPEFKHACLGGVYALKSALRYVTCDGQEKLAIVVAADVAEYERGSSGEQTQGAGAVAMLIERRPKMLAIDLSRSGCASDYRGPDFRKPFARHFLDAYASRTKRLSDFPVFSGRYST